MNKTLKNTNLFKYATSELSQDIFICWLLSHATESGWDEDIHIRNCAIDILTPILKSRDINWTNDMRVTNIQRQYKKIDVLVQIDDIYIIIEDKTFTHTHNNQINRYAKALTDTGVNAKNIICVYYKTEDQPHPEPSVDFEFARNTLLDIFSPYKNIITNPIFSNYLEYLEWIEYSVNSYKFLPISEWNHRSYTGFFKYLRNTILNNDESYWNNVNNPNGKFLALIFNTYGNIDLINTGIDINHIDTLYLQLGIDTIVIKYELKNYESFDKDIVKSILTALYNYFKKDLGIDFYKTKHCTGKCMTVGCIKYNEKNYIEKISAMQKAMSGLLVSGKII